MVPLTGGSYYLGSSPQFVADNYQKAIAGAVQQGGVPIEAPVYTSVLYPYLALSNADQAWQLFSQHISNIAPINPGDPIDKNLYDLPPQELVDVPTVCGSLREALLALHNDRAFLTKGDVFGDDQIDAYMELKWEEVLRWETTPSAVEYDMYYSA